MKTIKFLMTFAFFALLLVGKLNAQFSGGSGTEQDPYQITSKEDLKALADSVNNSPSNNESTRYNWSQDKHFILMNDITDSVKTIIGITRMKHFSFDEYDYFQGNFYGNNYKITLAISASDSMTGLFGSVSRKSIINNLTVDGYVYAGFDENTHSVLIPSAGGIAGMNYGKIENCVNKCSICVYSINDIINEYGGDHAGGIAGINCGEINYCKNYGTIETDFHDAGGIAGSGWLPTGGQQHSTISHCVNKGNIYVGKRNILDKQNSSNAGGIIGFNDGCLVINCINIGTVKGNRTNVGGIAGAMVAVTISNCINSGFIEGSSVVGGIVGKIIKTVTFSTLSNCINTGTVKSKYSRMGCIVGYNEGNSTIINCHYDKQICGGGE